MPWFKKVEKLLKAADVTINADLTMTHKRAAHILQQCALCNVGKHEDG